MSIDPKLVSMGCGVSNLQIQDLNTGDWDTKEWWDNSFMEYDPDLLHSIDPVDQTTIDQFTMANLNSLTSLESIEISEILISSGSLVSSGSLASRISSSNEEHFAAESQFAAESAYFTSSYPPAKYRNSYESYDFAGMKYNSRQQKLVSFSYNKHKLVNSVQAKITSFEALIENPKYFPEIPQNHLSGFRITKYKFIEDGGDVYLTKLNLQQLACVLNLQNFKVSLTKKIESQIMDIFNKYCINFQLGNKTVKRFSNLDRAIELLHAFTKSRYPFTKHHLEIIVRRSLYREMQNNLRRRKKCFTM